MSLRLIRSISLKDVSQCNHFRLKFFLPPHTKTRQYVSCFTLFFTPTFRIPFYILLDLREAELLFHHITDVFKVIRIEGFNAAAWINVGCICISSVSVPPTTYSHLFPYRPGLVFYIPVEYFQFALIIKCSGQVISVVQHYKASPVHNTPLFFVLCVSAGRNIYRSADEMTPYPTHVRQNISERQAGIVLKR